MKHNCKQPCYKLKARKPKFCLLAKFEKQERKIRLANSLWEFLCNKLDGKTSNSTRPMRLFSAISFCSMNFKREEYFFLDLQPKNPLR